jgi:hypothetical protein
MVDATNHETVPRLFYRMSKTQDFGWEIRFYAPVLHFEEKPR